MPASSQATIRWFTLVGMLAALTYVLYLPLFRIPIILFLELNLSEVVMFIAGFSLGPWAVLFTGMFRLLFALPFTTTGGIGELADLMYSLSFVLPGAILYQHHRTKQIATVGFMLGFALQLLVTSLMNALIITDLYLQLFLNITPAQFLASVQTAIPQVQDPYWSLVLWMYLPFNMLKNTIIIVLSLLTYKRVHFLIKRYRNR
jgi:riboflavin transporter FmnP